MRDRIVKRSIGLRRRCGIFHAAEDKIRNRDLRIARVRIRHADPLFESFDHSRRVAEGPLAVVFATGKHVIKDRDAVVPRLSLRDLDERTGDYRHQVRTVRHVLVVAKDGAFALVSALH